MLCVSILRPIADGNSQYTGQKSYLPNCSAQLGKSFYLQEFWQNLQVQ